MGFTQLESVAAEAQRMGSLDQQGSITCALLIRTTQRHAGALAKAKWLVGGSTDGGTSLAYPSPDEGQDSSSVSLAMPVPSDQSSVPQLTALYTAIHLSPHCPGPHARPDHLCVAVQLPVPI